MPSSREARPQRSLIRGHLIHFATLLVVVSLALVFIASPVDRSRRPHDELFAAPVNATRAAAFHIPDHSTSAPATLPERVEAFVGSVGTTILDLFGFETDADAMDGGAYGAGGLASWAESSVFVEVTNSLHPSRPSAFGPHLVAAPLRAPMYPITALTSSDEYGCASDPLDIIIRPAPPEEWIALTKRGHCPFSAKVRHAMAHNASGVLFGDLGVEEGGLGGMGGLLTPWSPDDTSDITIPSAFVSRASYLSLLKTWDDLQEGDVEMQGLMIVLSKDELFAWPLLDFLLLLLFLPSLLTLLTVFTHRVRLMRQRKADRAPRDVVAGLPVFVWGEREGEKRAGTSSAESADAGGGGALGEGTSGHDEEASVGMRPLDPPTEATALLRPSATSTRRTSFFARFFPVQTPTPPPSPPPAAPKHRKKYVSLNIECAICLADFVDGERVMELPCGHLYHQDEIESWLLGTRRLCPVCRASVTGESSSPALVPSEPPAGTEALPIIIAPLGDREGAARHAGAGASPVASGSLVTLESPVVGGSPSP